MPIDLLALQNTSLADVPVSYTEHDVKLYAMGVGVCRDPLAENELAYVSEHAGLRTMPTLASMLIPDTILAESGIEMEKLLHRSQALEFFRPLPAAAKLLANQRVVSVADRGAGIGAEIELETELRLARDDTVVFTGGSRVIARGDGGFGGPQPPVRSRHRMPDRDPDMICELPTRRDQALLFRLSGDLNALHADPQVARQAGFEQPILHGRCTYGIACHAILKEVCDYDFTLIRSFDVRFNSPVYPGDVITTEIWQDGNVVSFRCRIAERNVIVLNNGRCTLSA
jgi:acyl dehydratase